ncbi:MAG: hypothetical protein F6K56_32845 [Moorea sp. SIO3G5]|nr:hypothetical protein [Moorena sp. SIO3G5]
MDGVGGTGILDDKLCDWPTATLRERIISLTTVAIGLRPRYGIDLRSRYGNA